ncbi:Uncharacterized protein PBTT_01960 [Plasmodiophora brassicae]
MARAGPNTCACKHNSAPAAVGLDCSLGVCILTSPFATAFIGSTVSIVAQSPDILRPVGLPFRQYSSVAALRHRLGVDREATDTSTHLYSR